MIGVWCVTRPEAPQCVNCNEQTQQDAIKPCVNGTSAKKKSATRDGRVRREVVFRNCVHQESIARTEVRHSTVEMADYAMVMVEWNPMTVPKGIGASGQTME